MLLEHTGDAVHVRAPAKVNLVLEVLGKRADGYHDLEMANVTVSLYDEITIRRRTAPGIGCTVDRPGIPTDDRNLAVRAARALLPDPAIGLDLTLVKRIPAGAGLAGGSSDAAAVLVGVDRLLDLQTPPDVLAAHAAAIGSDVPYLLHAGAAICTGRGEVITPVDGPTGLPLVIAWPRVELATGAVFGATDVPLTPYRGRASVLFDRLKLGPGWAGVGEFLYNRLESAAGSLCEPIVGLRHALQSLGCLGVVMTGSGSAVLGLVESESDARDVVRAIESRVECDGFAVTLVAN